MLANSEVVISGTSYVKSKITNNDCILIYGSSSLVSHVLIQASQKFLNMHIIVVDSRPNLRGKIILEELVKNGIQCSYIMINAVSFVMNRVTKVIYICIIDFKKKKSKYFFLLGYTWSKCSSSQWICNVYNWFFSDCACSQII